MLNRSFLAQTELSEQNSKLQQLIREKDSSHEEQILRHEKDLLKAIELSTQVQKKRIVFEPLNLQKEFDEHTSDENYPPEYFSHLQSPYKSRMSMISDCANTLKNEETAE